MITVDALLPQVAVLLDTPRFGYTETRGFPACTAERRYTQRKSALDRSETTQIVELTTARSNGIVPFSLFRRTFTCMHPDNSSISNWMCGSESAYVLY